MSFRRVGRLIKTVSISSLLVSSCLYSSAVAIWPFPPKRFNGNSLINAGSLGLSKEGRVVAFGDFNGDQLYVVISAIRLTLL